MEEQQTTSPFGSVQVANEEAGSVQDATEQLRQIVQASEQQVLQQPAQSEQAIVQPQLEYAGFWVRYAALIVDSLVLLIPNIIVNIFFNGSIVGYFLRLMLMWGYSIYMLSAYGATLGKMAVGIKVVSSDGKEVEGGKVILREIVGKFLSTITLGIGYLMVIITNRKQTLHDKIADTVVVYDPSRKRRPWLTTLGIFLFLLIPIIGGIAALVVVSTSNARMKVLEAQNKAIEAQLERDALQQKNFEIDEE